MTTITDNLFYWILYVLLGKWTFTQSSTLVFRAVAGSTSQAYTIFTGQGRFGNPSDKTDHFKSDLIDQWEHLSITEVNMSVKVNNTEVSYFHFNGTASSRTSWFSFSNLLRSYPDDQLKNSFINHKGPTFGKIFSIKGAEWINRRFYINNNFGGCPADKGWLMLIDAQRIRGCEYELFSLQNQVVILYSWLKGPTTWAKSHATDVRADMLEIFIEGSNITSTPDLSCENCGCPKRTHVTNMTSEKLVEAISLLKEELKITRTTTSKYIRRKTSANDSRTSAKMIGVIGSVLLAIPIVLVILADLTNLRQKQEKRRTSPQS